MQRVRRIYYIKNPNGKKVVPRTEVPCQNCGKVMLLVPSQARIRKFCSKACDRDRGTVDERIAACSEPQANGCIHWIAYRSDGYGRIYIGGRSYFVHRVVWEKRHGKIPEGLVIRHKCDNPQCVNIEHLEIGTLADNCHDRELRGRGGDHRGIFNGRAKVNWEMVKAMRALRPPLAGHYHPIPYVEIARRFGLSKSQAYFIISKKCWVDNPAPMG